MGDNAKFSTGSDFLDYALIVPAMWNASMGGIQAIKDFPESLIPEIPDAPVPEAAVDSGDEGIRRGAMKRESRKREIGALYSTRGQRSDDSTLGGDTKSLGG